MTKLFVAAAPAAGDGSADAKKESEKKDEPKVFTVVQPTVIPMPVGKPALAPARRRRPCLLYVTPMLVSALLSAVFVIALLALWHWPVFWQHSPSQVTNDQKQKGDSLLAWNEPLVSDHNNMDNTPPINTASNLDQPIRVVVEQTPEGARIAFFAPINETKESGEEVDVPETPVRPLHPYELEPPPADAFNSMAARQEGSGSASSEENDMDDDALSPASASVDMFRARVQEYGRELRAWRLQRLQQILLQQQMMRAAAIRFWESIVQQRRAAEEAAAYREHLHMQQQQQQQQMMWEAARQEQMAQQQQQQQHHFWMHQQHEQPWMMPESGPNPFAMGEQPPQMVPPQMVQRILFRRIIPINSAPLIFQSPMAQPLPPQQEAAFRFPPIPPVQMEQQQQPPQEPMQNRLPPMIMLPFSQQQQPQQPQPSQQDSIYEQLQRQSQFMQPQPAQQPLIFHTVPVTTDGEPTAVTPAAPVYDADSVYNKYFRRAEEAEKQQQQQQQQTTSGSTPAPIVNERTLAPEPEPLSETERAQMRAEMAENEKKQQQQQPVVMIADSFPPRPEPIPAEPSTSEQREADPLGEFFRYFEREAEAGRLGGSTPPTAAAAEEIEDARSRAQVDQPEPSIVDESSTVPPSPTDAPAVAPLETTAKTASAEAEIDKEKAETDFLVRRI